MKRHSFKHSQWTGKQLQGAEPVVKACLGPFVNGCAFSAASISPPNLENGVLIASGENMISIPQQGHEASERRESLQGHSGTDTGTLSSD